MGVLVFFLSIYSIIITILFLNSKKYKKVNLKDIVYDFTSQLTNENNDFSVRALSYISKEFSEIDSGAFLIKRGREYHEISSFGKKIEISDKIFFYKDYLIKDFTIDESFGVRLILHSKTKLSKAKEEKIEIISTLISSSELIKNLIKKHGKFQIDLMLSMIKILEYYDRYTKGHSLRVAELSQKIAKKLRLSPQEVSDAYWTGLVHDIGKIAVPTNILNKEGKLTSEEYEIIKKHPIYGFEFLSTSETLKNIATYVYHHHEKWNGSGYPGGLKGEMIPMISRIISVADSWDAMTSKRAYRDALTYESSLQEIINNSGKQFDPKVVKAFISVLEEEENIA
ncbi:phosphohydrolase [Thermosipho melanesiensis]|uniref:Metal dependent phosphohydrolase n=2 Tax=Thermosipho melanesiensis TaxID=46541 RepID=A6LM97_THEM4|nr:HD-GYP domain-containing protein [Thermosipho melanesiensis]ABR31048.1 metal dependent phosphohydrolase [Thermosipho melanesiensis BI429]APT74142.1 phosphohydrolase [Thermosipho melanesiensis]OOC36089.1 phosphohydrolase [Thermosipho melanesiensis]OOC36906.1 phosphohydrolase [Thermosipho melanesiensis]OOC37657.1 phosphohydrolase [Thermosipho melanesiensis]